MWELDHKEVWVMKKWCFWTVVLKKTLVSLLDSKEIKPVNPKGNQSWIFTGRTDAEAKASIIWPPDAKSWLTGKDPDSVKDWGQRKRVTEDEMVGWHHQVNGHEFEQAPRDRERQGKLLSIGSQRVWHNWVVEQRLEARTIDDIFVWHVNLSKIFFWVFCIKKPIDLWLYAFESLSMSS